MAQNEEGFVTVSGKASGFAQEITIGPHRLSGDEPISAGGTDTGPNPHDFLLTALGSCTSMTVGWYARRREWPLESVSVRLRHSKIHAADCANCDSKDGMLDRIEREIELTGTLTADQRAKLLDIANRCPVHKTLMSKIEIITELKS